MPSYLHPGVYMEEVPSGARPIESVGTSTAAIIGFATKGPLDTPTLIFSWKEYQEQFGGIAQHASGDIDYMGHTVQAFFDNGGGKAYISRAADSSEAASAKIVLPLGTGASLSSDTNYINIKALSDGAWANGIEFKLEELNPAATPKTYTAIISRLNSKGEIEVVEQFDGVNLVPTSDTFIANVINGTSEFIEISSEVLATPLTLAEKEKYLIGSLTSADLSSALPSDFGDVSGKTIKLQLDGKREEVDPSTPVDALEFTITLNSPNNLAGLALDIEAEVRTTAPTSQANFTCKVENGHLVMTSGTHWAGSSVKIMATGTTLPNSPTTSIDFKNALTTSSFIQTGEEAFLASFSTSSTNTLEEGLDGSISNNYQDVFDALRKHRDANIILLPGHQLLTSASTIGQAVAHAQSMETCMVIIDPPGGQNKDTDELITAANVASVSPPTSEYTTMYYPWVEVSNPYYHAELRSHLKKSYLVPPSGFAAGLWARTDGKRGVWKAPAGLGASLNGALRTEFIVGDDQQDQLNPEGVNCIRKILSAPVIWGARTLATRAVPEKRYVPVQRTTLMIKESIYQGIQWAVFEPNDHNLWASLRLNLEAFMDGLHRAGAFQGEKASDAYFVRCGLGQTMTQGDIDAGRVIVEVGFAPLKPAEFVIVRLSQKTAQ